MPHKCPEKRKEVKRLNYIKNAQTIKARMAWNRRKKKILSWKNPEFTEAQVTAQELLISKTA